MSTNVLEDYFTCVNCGKLNSVAAIKENIVEEQKEGWSLWVYPSTRKMLSEVCARKGYDIDKCVEYLIALDVKENAAKMSQSRFGTPATVSFGDEKKQ